MYFFLKKTRTASKRVYQSSFGPYSQLQIDFIALIYGNIFLHSPIVLITICEL